MRRLVLAVLLVGLALLASGLWGLLTPAGRAAYPEGLGLYPFYAVIAGLACLTVAATARGMGRWRRRRRHTLLLAVLAAGTLVRPASAQEAPRARLVALLDQAWALEQRERSPGAAGAEGSTALPDMSPGALERRAAERRELLERLRAIDPVALPDQDRISHQMLQRRLEDQVAEHQYGGHLVPLTADWGFHIAFARLPDESPLATVADYEGYLASLRDFPRYVDDHVALLREGLRRGITLPRVVLEGYEGTIAAHVVDHPASSVFHRPFASFPAAIPAPERERLRRAGEAAIREAVVPGYRAFLEFMTREYIPGARASIAASELPDGPAYYRHRIRHFTTLDLTPEQVHRTGLAEVARIRAEMEEVMRRTGFEGTLPQFLHFLRTDPRFYATSPEQLLREAAWIAKRMDGALPSLFGRLPRQPYGIAPVPAEIAPKFTGGRYISAAPDAPRGGTYWVNTYQLESRPLYVLEALTLHEAVPGHHLQIALRQEMEGLPEIRRHADVPAFGEGWALYAERLGREAGFYSDPFSDFGRLTYEMWRACRLVVDTGLHALGWSRQQAMDYLAAHTALSLHEVRTETDRYISWPGQALAYKIGELKIRELRARAERTLGSRFDVRAFHDAVLASGEVPLPVLEEQVEEYIAGAGR